MITRLVFLTIFLLIIACKGTSLQTVTLTPYHEKLLCNGTKNLFHYIKQSQDVKDKYKIQEVRLKTDKQLYGKLSRITGDDLGLKGLTGSDYKVLKSKCDLITDKNPEFTLIFMYLVDTRELIGSIGTIVKGESFRTGFHFTTILNENGDIGQVKVEPISE